ncbi:MAG: ATP-binding cassette domain-containing protein [Pleomorphochaeta sp.]
MAFLHISNLSFKYQSSITPIFSSVNLTLSEDWFALIGPNGCGKTTLLNIIANKIEPDLGEISPKLSTYLCQQDTLLDIPEFFYSPDLINLPETNKILSKLEIKDDWTWRWDQLSGGEKKRCMIADAIIRKPEVLLIDEPANHLDIYSMNLLSDELKAYKGIGIIISHDLTFLDNICTKTIMIEPTKIGNQVMIYDCKPSIALEQRDKTIHYLKDQKSEQIKKIEHLKKIKHNEMQNIQASKNRLSKKNVSAKDFSTKSKIDGARLSSKDKKPGQRLSSINTEIKRNTQKLNNLIVFESRKTGVDLSGSKEKGNFILDLEKDTISLIENTLNLQHPNLIIKPEDRIILTGNNGTGKTTFIKYLYNLLENKNKSFWYLPQEFTQQDRIDIKNKILNLDKEKQAEIFSIVFRLGSNPTSIMNSDLISPGEAQKLLYGLAIISKASLLILDEPTNYLDILSIKSLIEALNNFNGAIIAVTHDRSFSKAIGKKNWNLIRNENLTILEETDII